MEGGRGEAERRCVCVCASGLPHAVLFVIANQLGCAPVLVSVCLCVLQISDTVVVKGSGSVAENMCSQATKAWDRVSYVIEDQEVCVGCVAGVEWG